MPKNIIILGLVSFFTDVSSEMLYPLIPLYLTMVLGASPAALGIIEGISESLASLLKIVSGRISDKLNRRKPLTIVGYGLSAVGKLLFIVAATWVGILWARMSDRFGKGIRTAPRDALIADSSPSGNTGKSFGLHRMMDTAGAVVGILSAYWLFTHYTGDYVHVFWVALIPAVIGVVLLFTIDEPGKQRVEKITQQAFAWSGLDKRLRYFIIVSFLFNLGNSSNQFLLIRAGTYGFTPAQIILLYLLMNITYFIISYPAGKLSDQIGRRALLVTGYSIYGFVYLGFAAAGSQTAIIALFAFYGLYIGMTEGIEKAFLADTAPAEQKASVYGLHALAVGISLLPASIIAGFLWDIFGAPAPFWFGGIMGLCAAAAIWFGLRT
ncbi:MAG: major facilitator superfamily 1 [Firmicutes bacterium]|nr:major facilitator superfamily 1 [Bacillota bacterium]